MDARGRPKRQQHQPPTLLPPPDEEEEQTHKTRAGPYNEERLDAHHPARRRPKDHNK
jgi:hypothetical protein